MTMREHVPFKEIITFRTKGTVRYFFDVHTVGELSEALHFAQKNNLPFFILGGGSNTLFVTNLYPGVVIKISFRGIAYDEKRDSIIINVMAGENWDDLVALTVQKNLWGLENLSFIPGSVGAAPIQNIGAYGVEVGDVIQSVDVFDIQTHAIRTLLNEECAFTYRSSLFKTEEGKHLIVVGVSFVLKKLGGPNLTYKDLAEYFKESKDFLTPLLLRSAVIAIRSAKLPDVKKIGTAGSFFKNPFISRADYEALKQRFPDVRALLSHEDQVKISAGWLLEHVGGFRGARRGDVGVWETQALVLVNFNEAEGRDVLAFAHDMWNKIKSEVGIDLEKEVVVI